MKKNLKFELNFHAVLRKLCMPHEYFLLVFKHEEWKLYTAEKRGDLTG